MRPLAVLGVTGSIGRQTLAVATQLGIPIVAIGAFRASEDFLAIARAYPEAEVALAGGDPDERRAFYAALGREVSFGPDALVAMAAGPNRRVMNAIVGIAGLPATLAAAEAGNHIALANKESMVAAGSLVNDAVDRGGATMIPVDSEHSAIFQCLVGEKDPARILLTASGGPFRGKRRDELKSVTPEQALRHPNWAMGRRITIDSATLANKALEVLEAVALFRLSLEQVDVVIHPESVVHSMVVFGDGSIKAQLGPPDMRLPIAYALTYPDRAEGIIPEFDFDGVSLHFEQPDRRAFPALELGYEAGRRGGISPAVFNAADEVAVAAFLGEKIGFAAITEVIEETMDEVEAGSLGSLADVLSADGEARRVAVASINKRLR
ncbi:1-deoxy-D-xylulose-5-phosphate reductoisomerase [soil metagenome]